MNISNWIFYQVKMSSLAYHSNNQEHSTVSEDEYGLVKLGSVGQRTAKLQVVKVGDLKKILLLGHSRTKCERPGFESQTMGSSSKFD